jgi:uncharacterized repeat protein (TIGR03943 family)
VNRETQHVLLGLLGGALVRIALDDTFLRYVRPAHRPLLLAAGAVLVALAVVAFLQDVRGARADRGHDHGVVERHIPWLLLAPVLVLGLVAPPALGADVVVRAGPGNAMAPDEYVFPPLPPGPLLELTVGEFVHRAAWDRSASLHGREVRLTGFAVRRGAAVELARLTIVCCAADARANRVRLAGDVGEVATDSWLRVQGTLQTGSATAATGYVPTLTVTAVEKVAAPPDPYEY